METPFSREELDVQYNARATVPDVQVYLDAYAEESARAARTLPCFRNISYGPTPDEMLDIFPAPGVLRAPVFIFIHGGYWRALSKDDSSFMAENLTRNGIAVAAVNYALAPRASLAEIVAQVRRALSFIWENAEKYHLDRDMIVAGGSSAGGHLMGMLIAGGWQEAYSIPGDAVKAAFGVSGLYDIEPLVQTHVNDWLKLNAGEARSLSPIHSPPKSPIPVTLSWGEAETREFKRQSRIYAEMLENAGCPVTMFEAAGKNHFDIVLDWQKSETRMSRELFQLFYKLRPEPKEP